MYTIRRTKDFERSFKKLKKSGSIKKEIFVLLEGIITTLILGETLDRKFKDHALIGTYKGYRECHIQNDLLLIYKIEDDELILSLIDIGSHSHLFG